MKPIENEKEYFDKLADSLGIPPEETEDVPTEVKKELEIIENKTVALQENINKNVILIKDQEYIDFELKDLIAKSNTVLENITSELKIGSTARMYEVFAMVISAKRELLKELIIFNKMLLDMTMFAPDDDKEKDGTDYNLTSDQLLNLITSAQKNSEVKEINVEFDLGLDK